MSPTRRGRWTATAGKPEDLVQVRTTIEGPLSEEIDIVPALKRGMELAIAAVRAHTLANLGGRMVRVRTGRLLGSVTTKVQTTASGAFGRVRVGKFYGRFTETGAVPHFVPRIRRRGRRRKPLAIHLGGATIFAARVRHPGIRARH